MLSLVVVGGPDRGRSLALPSREPQLIGRSSEALALADPTISRRHAELTPDGAAWRVRDLDSRHGTFVNGARISGAVVIAPGDRIRCGDTEILVLREGEAPNAAIDDGRRDASAIAIAARGRGEAGIDAVTDSGSDASSDAQVALELVARAAEPVDADVFLVEAARILARRLGGRAVAVRTRDPQLETFEVLAPGGPAAATSSGASPEPLALVRRAAASGEVLVAGDGDHALVVPFGSPGGIRGAFVLRRADGRPSDAAGIACASRAAEIASLALAARSEVRARGEQERLALVGETVAALSHSIKNVLQGLRFGADAIELALSRGELAKAQEGWPILQRNLDRVQALALNMLAWAKERPLEPEECDVHAILREVRDLLAPAAGHRRVEIVLEPDEAMPPIAVDAPALHQAVMNLALNAIEAAPMRTGLVVLASRYAAEADEAVLLVRDNGGGIPDAVRWKLFEPFVSSKGQRGTGLGLAVARRIAERHGGRLELVETSPKGTAFALSLPASGWSSDPGETRAPRGMRPSDFGWRFG